MGNPAMDPVLTYPVSDMEEDINITGSISVGANVFMGTPKGAIHMPPCGPGLPPVIDQYTYIADIRRFAYRGKLLLGITDASLVLYQLAGMPESGVTIDLSNTQPLNVGPGAYVNLEYAFANLSQLPGMYAFEVYEIAEGIETLVSSVMLSGDECNSGFVSISYRAPTIPRDYQLVGKIIGTSGSLWSSDPASMTVSADFSQTPTIHLENVFAVDTATLDPGGVARIRMVSDYYPSVSIPNWTVAPSECDPQSNASPYPYEYWLDLPAECTASQVTVTATCDGRHADLLLDIANTTEVPPVINLTVPVDTHYEGSTVTVHADVSGVQPLYQYGVEFRVDGQLYGFDAFAPYDIEVMLLPGDGVNTVNISARAIDTFGRTVDASEDIPVVKQDTVNYALDILSSPGDILLKPGSSVLFKVDSPVDLLIPGAMTEISVCPGSEECHYSPHDELLFTVPENQTGDVVTVTGSVRYQNGDILEKVSAVYSIADGPGLSENVSIPKGHVDHIAITSGDAYVTEGNRLSIYNIDPATGIPLVDVNVPDEYIFGGIWNDFAIASHGSTISIYDADDLHSSTVGWLREIDNYSDSNAEIIFAQVTALGEIFTVSQNSTNTVVSVFSISGNGNILQTATFDNLPVEVRDIVWDEGMIAVQGGNDLYVMQTPWATETVQYLEALSPLNYNDGGISFISTDWAITEFAVDNSSSMNAVLQLPAEIELPVTGLYSFGGGAYIISDTHNVFTFHEGEYHMRHHFEDAILELEQTGNDWVVVFEDCIDIMTLTWPSPSAFQVELEGLNGTLTPTSEVSLTANVSGAKGIVPVTFAMDDRVMCVDYAAPYTCRIPHLYDYHSGGRPVFSVTVHDIYGVKVSDSEAAWVESITEVSEEILSIGITNESPLNIAAGSLLDITFTLEGTMSDAVVEAIFNSSTILTSRSLRVSSGEQTLIFRAPRAPAGSYDLLISAVSVTGAASASDMVTLNIMDDAVAPVLSCELVPPATENNEIFKGIEYVLSVSAVDCELPDMCSGVERLKFYQDGSWMSDVLGAVGAFPFSVTDDITSSITVKAEAVDGAGNISQFYQQYQVIDPAPPALTLTAPSSLIETQLTTIGIEIIDDSSLPVTLFELSANDVVIYSGPKVESVDYRAPSWSEGNQSVHLHAKAYVTDGVYSETSLTVTLSESDYPRLHLNKPWSEVFGGTTPTFKVFNSEYVTLNVWVDDDLIDSDGESAIQYIKLTDLATGEEVEGGCSQKTVCSFLNIPLSTTGYKVEVSDQAEKLSSVEVLTTGVDSDTVSAARITIENPIFPIDIADGYVANYRVETANGIIVASDYLSSFEALIGGVANFDFGAPYSGPNSDIFESYIMATVSAGVWSSSLQSIGVGSVVLGANGNCDGCADLVYPFDFSWTYTSYSDSYVSLPADSIEIVNDISKVSFSEGFQFRFGGQQWDSVWLDRYGALIFSGNIPSAGAIDEFSLSDGNIHGIMALMFQNVAPMATRYVQSADQFTVQWSNNEGFQGQIILNGTDGSVRYSYGAGGPYGDYIVGIENADGLYRTAFDQIGKNVIGSNTQILWKPGAVTIEFYSSDVDGDEDADSDLIEIVDDETSETEETL